MPWWAWLLLAIYIAGWLVAFHRISGQLAWHMAAHRTFYSWQTPVFAPSGEQWFGALLAGCGLAFFWPLSLLVAHGIASARDARGWFYTPPKARERLYKERIAKLEREAGIR